MYIPQYGSKMDCECRCECFMLTVCGKESKVCLVNIWMAAVQIAFPRMLTFMWKTSPRALGFLLALSDDY